VLKPKFIPSRLIGPADRKPVEVRLLTEPDTFRGFQVLGPVSHADLAAWSVQTSSTCKLRMPPGRHFFLNASRTLLLQALAEDIAELAAC
jgi:hypothetical protein